MPRNTRCLSLLLIMTLLVSACGGPRINRKPQEMIDHGAMITVDDPHVQVVLDQIMYRNSPGSWAKDANWDEYLLTLKPADPTTDIFIESILIEDVMGALHGPEITRKALNKSTKRLKKKYKQAGYKVRLGAGSTHATAIGLSLAMGGSATAGAATATGAIGQLTSAGVGVAVAVPALMIAGLTKVVYNTKVNNKIQQRQTLLPHLINDRAHQLDLFFPAVPMPQKLVVNYRHQNVNHQITLDLTSVTTDLHIKQKK